MGNIQTVHKAQARGVCRRPLPRHPEALGGLEGGLVDTHTSCPAKEYYANLSFILRDTAHPTAELPLVGRKVIPRIKTNPSNQLGASPPPVHRTQPHSWSRARVVEGI